MALPPRAYLKIKARRLQCPEYPCYSCDRIGTRSIPKVHFTEKLASSKTTKAYRNLKRIVEIDLVVWR